MAPRKSKLRRHDSFHEPSPSGSKREPGEDFIESIGEIFDEAKAKGLLENPKDLQSIKESTINLLDATGRMTSAKARAQNPIRFSNGEQPLNAIQFPPKSLKLGPPELKELHNCISEHDFTRTLKQMIAAQEKQKKEKLASPRKKQRSGVPSHELLQVQVRIRRDLISVL